MPAFRSRCATGSPMSCRRTGRREWRGLQRGIYRLPALVDGRAEQGRARHSALAEGVRRRGPGLAHQIIIADEMARADAPQARMFTISLIHMPGTLFPHGTEAQKRRYLAGVAKGDVWCQGFSEPNSGSDLASLAMRAVRDGDHYVINGQKIWSSYSMYARLLHPAHPHRSRARRSTAASPTSSWICSRPASRCGRSGRRTAGPSSASSSSPMCAIPPRT